MVENDFPDDIANKLNPFAYRRFFIPPGPQHLDGVTALEYVRARHSDLTGDFGRSERQQQVLVQLKTKLKDADIFSIGPSLIESMSGEARTDMTSRKSLAWPDRSSVSMKSRSIDGP